MTTVATVQGVLFEPPLPAPVKPDLNPAYLPTRESAERTRDYWLSRFYRHREDCRQCAAATDHHGVCAQGYTDVILAARIQRDILAGCYLEPRKPAVAAQRTTTTTTEDTLFDPAEASAR
jgi:hypothetical protein